VIKNPFSSVNQIKLGAILSYSTIVLTNILGIVLTPFTIRMLGDAEYGLYLLMGSIIGYMTVLDFGLTNTIVRYVAKYRAENDRMGEERFLATAMLIYLAIAFLIVVIGALIYVNLNLIFSKSLTAEELIKAKIMFLILIFNLAIALPGGAFGAICNGHEHFVIPRAVTVGRYILRSAMLVGILWLGGKAISIVILDTCMNITAIIVNANHVANRIKIKISFSNIDTSLIRKIFSYSIWIFVFAIVGQFQWRTGQVVLGILSGTKAVAIYGVGVMLGTYYGSFSTAISSLFLPRATKMIATLSTADELTDMMVKIGRLSLIVLFYILGAFILFGRDFIFLWVGEGYHDAWFVALALMFGYTTPLVQSFANSILEARALLSFKALLYLGVIALGTVVGALLVNNYGVAGMVVGSVAAWLVSQIVMNVYYSKVLKLNVFRFFRDLYSRILLAFLFVMIVCSFAGFHGRVGWGYLIVNVSIYSAVYVVVMFRFGMNTFEKDLVVVPFTKLGIIRA
jgi:O-antigen/teichoic acid export membrane protein